MSKVAIIITTYKHEKFIIETIESILSQTYTDWELFIGDDSPDNATWHIIQSYLGKYPSKIHAWHHNPNKWIVGNMNFLLEKVPDASQYICFLEGDDIYTPNHLQKKLEIWNRYPDIWLVYNELSIIDDEWKILEKQFLWSRTRKWYKNETNTIWKLLASDIVCFSYSTLMVKRFNGMKINDFWKKDLMWSESDFWLQITKESNIYGIEESLTLYRKHANNTSKDANVSIGHFEFLVNVYFDRGYISTIDYRKVQVLISMMRCFVYLWQTQYLKSFYYFFHCFNLSFFDTLIVWLNSAYYRMIKPCLFKVFYK